MNLECIIVCMLYTHTCIHTHLYIHRLFQETILLRRRAREGVGSDGNVVFTLHLLDCLNVYNMHGFFSHLEIFLRFTVAIHF